MCTFRPCYLQCIPYIYSICQFDMLVYFGLVIKLFKIRNIIFMFKILLLFSHWCLGIILNWPKSHFLFKIDGFVLNYQIIWNEENAYRISCFTICLHQNNILVEADCLLSSCMCVSEWESLGWCIYLNIYASC